MKQDRLQRAAPLLLAASLLTAGPALAAPCTAKDAWTGRDKALHLKAGLAIGAAGTLVFDSPRTGMLLGVGAGLAKEVYDRRGGGTCSLQDFAVTAVGAAAGA